MAEAKEARSTSRVPDWPRRGGCCCGLSCWTLRPREEDECPNAENGCDGQTDGYVGRVSADDAVFLD